MLVSPQNPFIEKPDPQGDEVGSRDKSVLSQQKGRDVAVEVARPARKPEGTSIAGAGVTRAVVARTLERQAAPCPHRPCPTGMRSFSLLSARGVTSRLGEGSKSGNT